MHTSIKTNFIISLLFISLCISESCAQEKYNTTYSIEAIPNINRFEIMTENEVRIDTLMEKHHTESLQQMMDGSAFIEGVSEKDKQEAIDYENIKYKRYKNNRSRYFLELYVNNKKDNQFIESTDTLTTECSCYKSNDTIKVKMGFWVFGGFTFSIDITKNNFKSLYWEDTHEQPIYKADLRTKYLVDNVTVENEEQALILENKPTFTIGETMLGQLTFKTKNYYRKSNYRRIGTEDDITGKQMDTLNMAGSLYFKCTLREKTRYDE